MTILTCDQRSPDWYKARLGRLCSSDVNAMLAEVKSGEAAGRRNLRVKLMLERLTGKAHDRDFTSQAMQDGIDREAIALALYEAQTGLLMNHAGFIAHDTLMAGWSPDGYTDDMEGFVEAKCPIAATHLETLRTRKVPTEYLRQMRHGGFWIGGAQWGDFVSYCPEFPEFIGSTPAQLVIVRVTREQAQVQEYETAAVKFLEECDRELASLKGWSALQPA